MDADRERIGMLKTKICELETFIQKVKRH